MLGYIVAKMEKVSHEKIYFMSVSKTKFRTGRGHRLEILIVHHNTCLDMTM